MEISNADIVKAASAMGVLGGGAQTAHRILAALCDPDLDSRQIADLILREPGLAARVLKVANSAYYGQARNIATLDRALMVLGLDAVRGIAAAACLDRSIASRTQFGAIDPRALVNHCVASAFAAEQLAKISGHGSAAEAFMAALLHDFGVPIQERLDGEGVAALIKALREQPDADIQGLEKSLVKIPHARCAQVVFDDWKLPPSISLAALHHDDPNTAPGPVKELTTLVHLGIQLAIEANFTYPAEPRQFSVAREPLLRSLGLEAEALQPIVAGLPERVLLLMNAAA
ncbi:MAG: HDOD domain-containing protein [Steroidobacteraceae bacterium]